MEYTLPHLHIASHGTDGRGTQPLFKFPQFSYTFVIIIFNLIVSLIYIYSRGLLVFPILFCYFKRLAVQFLLSTKNLSLAGNNRYEQTKKPYLSSQSQILYNYKNPHLYLEAYVIFLNQPLNKGGFYVGDTCRKSNLSNHVFYFRPKVYCLLFFFITSATDFA